MTEVQSLPLRKDVSTPLQWDLTTIYPTDKDFENDLASLKNQVKTLDCFRGTLNKGAQELFAATTAILDSNRKLEKAYVYSHLKNDQDTSNEYYQEIHAKMESLAAEFGAQTAFYEPELLKIDQQVINEYLQEIAGFEEYQRFFDQIFEQKEHILSNEVESVLAGASDIFSSGEKAFGILNNTDLKFPVVEDEAGNPVELSHGMYSLLIESTDRSVRQQAFTKLYEVYRQFQHVLAATLTTNVKQHNFKANLRNYASARQAALTNNEIPESVYDTLIEVVNKNLPLLHRYVNLRKRILGVDELHMYDLYTPLVGDKSPRYTFEEAKQTTIEALAILGDDYTNHVRKEFSERWVDVVENKYKRSGAYSSGMYDTNPFILLNWQDNLDNLYTLVHETGHSMHSYYTTHNQPYQYGDYSIFVAEIASTTNENLLTDYLLKTVGQDDIEMKKHILNYYLDGFKGTVFRQTQFAEFEQFIHESQASGVPLTASYLNEHYLKLNQKYYGDGVVSDPEIGLEWSRIPHFYYNYYVYQYATGFASATTLANNIINGTDEDIDKYLNYLKAGSSDTPINVIKKAGVDMTNSAYLEKAFQIFEQRLNEFEQLFK